MDLSTLYKTKLAPERQEASGAWLGVEPETDTTGSRNKHGHNMAFVTRKERERKGTEREMHTAP